MSDSIERLYASTAALYARFGVVPQHDNTARVFAEEVREFQEAVIRFHVGGSYTSMQAASEAMQHHSDNVLNEAADVLVTLIGCLIAAGVQSSELSHAIERVIAKNDAKTHDTHELVRGKITRCSDKRSDS